MLSIFIFQVPFSFSVGKHLIRSLNGVAPLKRATDLYTRGCAIVS